jgi:metal-responsive CopG/Arc/MetJ family transcriptional regulator
MQGFMGSEEEVSIPEEDSIRLSFEISRSLLGKIDEMRNYWGFRSRGATIQRILIEIFEEIPSEETEENETNLIDELENQHEESIPELSETSDSVTDPAKHA